MNKVILMETEETPSLGPSSCCFARLILSFALRPANLYEVPLLKCEGDGKGLHTLFVFLHYLSRLSRSLHRLSFSSLTSSIPQHSQSVYAMYETLNSLSIVFYCSYSLYTWRTNHDRFEWFLNRILSFSQSVHVTYETMTVYRQCGAHSGSPQQHTQADFKIAILV